MASAWLFHPALMYYTTEVNIILKGHKGQFGDLHSDLDPKWLMTEFQILLEKILCSLPNTFM